jgi:hypothetical protein
LWICSKSSRDICTEEFCVCKTMQSVFYGRQPSVLSYPHIVHFFGLLRAMSFILRYTKGHGGTVSYIIYKTAVLLFILRVHSLHHILARISTLAILLGGLLLSVHTAAAATLGPKVTETNAAVASSAGDNKPPPPTPPPATISMRPTPPQARATPPTAVPLSTKPKTMHMISTTSASPLSPQAPPSKASRWTPRTNGRAPQG